MITLPPALHAVTQALAHEGLRPVVVGGYVRDALLGNTGKDIDVEIFGAESADALKKQLLPFGEVYEVGKSFGVLKMRLDGCDVDFSLPRTEIKSGNGHRGFTVAADGNLDFATAARRRDFTVNAIGFDLAEARLIDPYNGCDDLAKQRLHCVNEKTFAEDPLRIFRALQFAARFDLKPTPELTALCARMTARGAVDELPKERIFEEFRKLLLKAEKPSIGLALLEPFGLLPYFPELAALKGCPQDTVHHPEGDVWTHTLLALDAMASRRPQEEKRALVLMFAVLCHDFGKPLTTECIDGELHAYGHEEAGLEPTRHFLERLTDEKQLVERVLSLVAHHGKPHRFFKEGAKPAAFRRLALKADLHDLLLVAKADHLGRTTFEAKSGIFAAEQWFLFHADSIGVLESPPEPLLKGRDLIAMGYSPSPDFKPLLDTAFEAQLDGAFDDIDGARRWLDEHLSKAQK